ncbi:MAG: hypothetical protein IKO13_00900 [Oscillospiraceae bacterium]|nr:hypothetical protein [Oscillospiraceae bacterium]
MKTIKKGLALLLALMMVLSLTACDNLQTLKTVRKIQKLESYHADCSVDMNMGLGMLDQSLMNLEFHIGADADVNRDPLLGEGTFQAELMDETREGQFYFAKEDDTLTLYLSTDGGETWKATPIDLSESTPDTGFGLSKESLEWMLKAAATFEETGEEEINGYTATVYEGFISGEELKAMMDEADALGAVAAGMELDPDELQLEEVGDIPVTVALGKESGLPVRFTVDLSALMDSMLPLFLQVVTKASAESGEDAGEILGLLSFMEVSFDEFLITVHLSDFDEAPEVSIPEEVLEAAEPEDAVEAAEPEETVELTEPEDVIEAAEPEEVIEAAEPKEVVEDGIPGIAEG